MPQKPALAFAILALAASPAARAADPPLNIVFILTDDLGQRDLGCYGSTFYETPNLDALAAGGMRFTSAYAACQVCSPTRASIQTGKYPARLHTTDYFGGPLPEQAMQMPRFMHRKLLPPAYSQQLPLDEVTIAEALRDAGYATCFAGKWHLGPNKDYWPPEQGYDVSFGGSSAGSPRSYFSPYGNPTLADGPPGEHLPDRLASEVNAFVRQHRDQPFFVFLSMYDVHVPLQARKDLQAKYEAKAKLTQHDGPATIREGASQVRQVQDHAVYAAMVDAMDQAVGKVLRGLEEAGVADRTAVIFTSDNGGLSTAEGAPTCNLPFRAGKGWMYEGGVREPLIVRWPGHARAGATCDSYLISTDYYPTILDMAGLPSRPTQHIDGKSFVALLTGEQDNKRGPIFWHYPHYGNQGGSPASAVRDGDWKLIEFLEDGRRELYNLAQDLGERHNLADQDPERVARLTEQLHAWRLSVDAQMPSPNPLAQSSTKNAQPAKTQSP